MAVGEPPDGDRGEPARDDGTAIGRREERPRELAAGRRRRDEDGVAVVERAVGDRDDETERRDQRRARADRAGDASNRRSGSVPEP
jgi:hypothetical protein